MKKLMVCTVCEARGTPVMHTKGSFLIELFLWLCFIVPGLIYSIWRLATKKHVCSKCGSYLIVPDNSPAGKRILNAGKSQ